MIAFANCAILAAVLLLAAPGCRGAAEVMKSLPPGSQLQSSTFGIKVAPQAVDGTPLVVGSHSTIFTTAQPENAPNLNRFEGRAPFTNVKSTVATGAVGEQLKAAGGPEALKHLLGTGKPLELPTFRPQSEAVPEPIAIPRSDRGTPLQDGAALERAFPQPLTQRREGAKQAAEFAAFPESKAPLTAPDPRRSLQLPPNFSD